jgi:hypothetical protein
LVGIAPVRVQPSRRKVSRDNQRSMGLSTGVVKMVMRIRLLEKKCADHTT